MNLSRPLWPGHKPTQLYVVIHEPRQEYRRGLVSLIWFTHADSKAEAIRDYLRDLGNPANAQRDRHYKKPTAQLVVTGGDAIRV